MFIHKPGAPLPMKVRVPKYLNIIILSSFGFANKVSYGSPLQDPCIRGTTSLQGHNEEGLQEEDNVISALVIIPDRDLRQPRSSGGKLAYVIFGDQTTGIYYNWYDPHLVEYVWSFQTFKEFL